jgi:hypothetical protein
MIVEKADGLKVRTNLKGGLITVRKAGEKPVEY